MTRFYRFISVIAVLIMAQFIALELHAQQSDREGKTIVAIDVKGNKSISTESVLSKVKTKAGDPFDQLTLNDDLKRLYAMDYFTNVTIDVEDSRGGVAVAFIVEEKPVIEDIEFKGNRVFRAQKLKAAIKSKPDEMLNLSLLASDITELKNMYIKKGYPLVDVTYKIEVGKELNLARIVITIDEKSRVTVKKITITGNKAIKTKDILKVLGVCIK